MAWCLYPAFQRLPRAGFSAITLALAGPFTGRLGSPLAKSVSRGKLGLEYTSQSGVWKIKFYGVALDVGGGRCLASRPNGNAVIEQSLTLVLSVLLGSQTSPGLRRGSLSRNINFIDRPPPCGVYRMF